MEVDLCNGNTAFCIAHGEMEVMKRQWGFAYNSSEMEVKLCSGNAALVRCKLSYATAGMLSVEHR